VVEKLGAVCNTDHKMLWMKLKFRKKFCRRREKKKVAKRFDMAKLEGQCVDERSRELPNGRFVSGVGESMKRSWDSDGSVQEK